MEVLKALTRKKEKARAGIDNLSPMGDIPRKLNCKTRAGAEGGKLAVNPEIGK